MATKKTHHPRGYAPCRCRDCMCRKRWPRPLPRCRGYTPCRCRDCMEIAMDGGRKQKNGGEGRRYRRNK